MTVSARPDTVQVHTVRTASGTVLLSITTNDPRRAGGLVMLPVAALHALPAALAAHLEQLKQEVAA